MASSSPRANSCANSSRTSLQYANDGPGWPAFPLADRSRGLSSTVEASVWSPSFSWEGIFGWLSSVQRRVIAKKASFHASNSLTSSGERRFRKKNALVLASRYVCFFISRLASAMSFSAEFPRVSRCSPLPGCFVGLGSAAASCLGGVGSLAYSSFSIFFRILRFINHGDDSDRRERAEAGKATCFLGFLGSPWTVDA